MHPKFLWDFLQLKRQADFQLKMQADFFLSELSQAYLPHKVTVVGRGKEGDFMLVCDSLG